MKLEVGMVIYNGVRKYTITRVTNTLAYAEYKQYEQKRKLTFNREICDPYCFNVRGAYKYSTESFSIETEELIHKRKRFILESVFRHISVDTLTDDQLNTIILIYLKAKSMNDITYCATSPYETCKDCERNFSKIMDKHWEHYSKQNPPELQGIKCPSKYIRKVKK